MKGIFISIIISLLVSIIFIVFLKKDADGENIDKGILGQNYFNLSYKRRMINNLIGYPILSLILITVYIFIDLSQSIKIAGGLIVLIACFAEVTYNYKMWQKHEK